MFLKTRDLLQVAGLSSLILHTTFAWLLIIRVLSEKIGQETTNT